MPGGLTRLGPGETNGLARSAKTGSVRMLQPGHLDQEGRMADQRRPQIRRRGGRLVGERAGKGSAASALRPPPSCQRSSSTQPLVLRLARAEEAHAVEMVAGRPVIIGIARTRSRHPAAGPCRDQARHRQDFENFATVHGFFSRRYRSVAIAAPRRKRQACRAPQALRRFGPCRPTSVSGYIVTLP